MKAQYAQRKITTILPEELINRALKATGEGLTTTLRRGLELVAAKDVYAHISSLRGKYKKKGLGITLDKLREDRE